MPAVSVNETRTKHDFEVLEHVEKAIAKMTITIQHGGVRAFYSPSRDLVTLPEKDRFQSSSDYYATAWHELVHATGHKNRLDRD